MKEQFRESHSGCKISGISFGVLSANQMRQMAHINVLTNNLYEPNTRKPAVHGVLDLRLGTSIKSETCQTCSKNWADCSGHFGFIDLEMPCFHVGFFKSIINILQCICKNCSSILLDPLTKASELAKIGRLNMSYLEKKVHRKRIIGLCKKINKCPYCGEYNGIVKKCSLLKIVHMKYQHGKRTEGEKVKEYMASFENALLTNKDLGTLLHKAQEILNPLKVMELFKRIPCSDIALLLMDHQVGRPQDLILTRIFVPPTCIRPSVVSDLKAGTTEDDITMRLLDIIQQNNNLVQMAQSAGWMGRYMEVWDYLQLQVALLYNSELSGIPKFSQESKKPLMGIMQRLKGKQGRFRGNLSGKRVNFSARTVISPDPHLRIDQVGLPMHMAKILTFPERVTTINYEKMRQLVLNGRDVHPGASSVIKEESKIKFHVFNSHRTKMARELKIGDIVNRYIWDGDVVLFNRQPSLHRLSIQAFRVKVTNSRTLQFNECCCNPFNADFDGDEMNIHFPQTEEAKAEALILMESKSNIISPRNGDPLIAGIQDFITGAYLLTQKNNFFTIDGVMRIVNALIDTHIDLPKPAILKPVKLWTGKQIFSLVIRPSTSSDVLVNLRMKCTARNDSGKLDYNCPSCTKKMLMKTYEAFTSTTPCISCPDQLSCASVDPSFDPMKILCEDCCVRYLEIRSLTKVTPCSRCDDFNKTSRQDELDPDDDYVVIHNSQLLAGYMDKGTLGSGSKNSIFYFILRDFGKDNAADALLRLSKLSSLYLILRGFSIGISDVTPGPALLKTKLKLLEEGYTKCNEYIYQYDNGQLQVAPGCSEEETLEGILLNTLSDIRDEAGRACHRDLPKTNSPLIMSIAGSKGSNVNISQMIACVGQQSVSGRRVPNGFEGRTLPHFVRNSKDPAAKGFVANSFFSGLTPIESFLHAIAGREGLVDTAVKTAETGYMQRRLVKALEDLYCAYDGTVRNSVGEVIQFVYGSDGLDAMAMEAKYKKSKNSQPTKVDGLRPIDFARVLEQTCKANPCRNEMTLTGEQVMRIYSRLLELSDYKFMKSHKLSKGSEHQRRSTYLLKEAEDPTNGKAESLSNQPERARNFGRHMRKFIDSLVANLKQGRVLPDGVCKHSRITRTQLENFLSMCSSKFMSAQMEPGTTVGALAAQSIGEPSTQMTLKTFHFAGVASMNITQGVPRILEIINATRSISTPVAKCPIEIGHDEGFARRVKGRIEKTTLGEITQSFVTNIVDDDMSVMFKLDLRRIELLKLEVNVHTVRTSLLRAVKLKLEHGNIDIISKSEMIVRPSKNYKGSPLWALYNLRVSLPNIIVSGIVTVKRVVMQAKGKKDEFGKIVHELIVEGTNLQAIMTTPGVVGRKVESNNIMEIKQTLGIEAARAAIITEMTTTMAIYGISVDKRHIMLVADLMTYRGEVMGINRGGMARMRESALMLASFEKTADHLFEAAYHGQMDSIRGVSERIIMGIPMDIGTGMIDVFQKIDREPDALMNRATIFESYGVHLPGILLNASENSLYANSSTSGEG